MSRYMFRLVRVGLLLCANPHAPLIHIDIALAEELSTEAIWFGFDAEVTIATRHETTVNKAPSIVTVITPEEIKITDTRNDLPAYALLNLSVNGCRAKRLFALH